jgi:hypothetical protein
MSDVVEKIMISCPRCGRRYRVAAGIEGKQVRCSCGEEFPAVPLAPAAVSSPIVADLVGNAVPCRYHAGVPAVAACYQCRAMICTTCDCPMSDGSHLCPTCASTAEGAASLVRESRSPFATIPPGTNCRAHPAVPATAMCRNCQAPVCATCDFAVAPGVHLCPSCATAAPKLSSTRKAMAIWSIVMAGWVTFMVALSMTGALVGLVRDELGASLVGSAMILPALIGLALSCGSMDRRAGNPPLVWVALVWNIIMTVVWVALMVIGLTMR